MFEDTFKVMKIPITSSIEKVKGSMNENTSYNEDELDFMMPENIDQDSINMK
jgi:hypothetical protein